jgi:hypothetical protein
MIAYCLDKNINGGKILQDIQGHIDLVKKNSQGQSLVLYIDVRPITSENTSIIPKITHKSQDDCPT